MKFLIPILTVWGRDDYGSVRIKLFATVFADGYDWHFLSLSISNFSEEFSDSEVLKFL